MITSLEISHYRSISHAKIKLRPINILVGANGSGKSNLVDAIYFLHDCCVNSIDTAITRRHGIDYVRQWSKSKPFHISIDVSCENEWGKGRYKVILSSYKGSHRILDEFAQWDGLHPYLRYSEGGDKNKVGTSTLKRTKAGSLRVVTTHANVDLARLPTLAPTELFLSHLQFNPFNDALSLFSEITRELASFALYSIYPNTLRQPQLISREKSLMEDGSNLASVLKEMPTKRKSEIISGIKSILPAVEDYRISSAGGFYVPTLRVRETNGENHYFGLSQISDGTLRVLGILTALYQPRAPAKIALEEPEQMIHPGALDVIAEAVKDFANPQPSARGGVGSQIFITTHSPHLIDMFDPETLVWTRKVDGVTEAGHVSDRQMGLIRESLFTAGELMLSEGIF